MKLVIIAAGKGSRISSVSDGLPKTFLKINNKRIIDVLLDNCVRVGIRECVIVTGYRDDIVRSHLGQYTGKVIAHIVHNPEWALPNGLSVLRAKSVIPESQDFLVSMSDHLYGPTLLKRIKNSSLKESVVNIGLDFNLDGVFDLADGMKVKTDPDDAKVILSMSKDLLDYDAIDCGVFKCRYDFFGVLEEAKEKGLYALSDACNLLVRERKLGGVDIQGDFWLDIDTRESLEVARGRSTFL